MSGGLLRSATLAAASALITAAGHVAGGGALPDLGLLVVLVPLLAGAFGSVAQRSRTLAGLVATLGAGQFVLHHLLVFLHAGHTGDGPMLGMHASATLVIAVMLRQADAAWAAIGAALARILPRRMAPLPAGRPLPPLVGAGSAVPARIARLLAVADARRGPPVGC